MVKLEGGEDRLDVIKALVREGIPVAGHLGLLPQSVLSLGGYTVQARDATSAERLVDEARLLDEAGISALVLECIPQGLAERITRAVSAPTIGIGAGPSCDGQVLVMTDMLGMAPKCPKFCRNFMLEAATIPEAFSLYVAAVHQREFPNADQSFI